MIKKIAVCSLCICLLMSGCTNKDKREYSTLELALRTIEIENHGEDLQIPYYANAYDLVEDDIYFVGSISADSISPDQGLKLVKPHVFIETTEGVSELFETDGSVLFLKVIDDTILLVCYTGEYFVRGYTTEGELLWETHLNFQTDKAQESKPNIQFANDRLLVGALVDEVYKFTRYYWLDTDGHILMTFEQDLVLSDLVYCNEKYYCIQGGPFGTTFSYSHLLYGRYFYATRNRTLVEMHEGNGEFEFIPCTDGEEVSNLSMWNDEIFFMMEGALYKMTENHIIEKIIDKVEVDYYQNGNEVISIQMLSANDISCCILITVYGDEILDETKYFLMRGYLGGETSELYLVANYPESALMFIPDEDRIVFMRHKDFTALGVYSCDLSAIV